MSILGVGDAAGMTEQNDPEKTYWYRVKDGVVEQGPQSPGTQRMGPYATRAEAEQALQSAAARTQAWDEEDRRDEES